MWVFLGRGAEIKQGTRLNRLHHLEIKRQIREMCEVFAAQLKKLNECPLCYDKRSIFDLLLFIIIRVVDIFLLMDVSLEKALHIVLIFFFCFEISKDVLLQFSTFGN